MADGEAFWQLAATTTLPHRDVSGLEVAAEPIRVKERMGCAILCELGLHGAKQRCVLCQTQRQRFIVGERIGHELREPHRMQEAPGHPRRQRLATKGDQGKASP
jgi:hypothetical protein